MDFKEIFQLKDKKFWWIDIIFYFVISMFIAVVFCYVIFIIKNNIQRNQIEEEEVKIEEIASEQQRMDEKEVILYKKKIGDFAGLLENHEFLSHALIFMKNYTRPDVWIKNINVNETNRKLLVAGETDNMEALSRQVAVFEKNKYVAKVDLLNSNKSDSSIINFNLNLVLNPEIFSYIPENQDEPAE
jgi:hypothetical protein